MGNAEALSARAYYHYSYRNLSGSQTGLEVYNGGVGDVTPVSIAYVCRSGGLFGRRIGT